MPQAAPVTGTETSSPGVVITFFWYSQVIAYQANSGCHSSRVLASWASPHSSPLEGGGFEPSVPHQEGQPSDVVFRFARDSSHETLRWREMDSNVRPPGTVCSPSIARR